MRPSILKRFVILSMAFLLSFPSLFAQEKITVKGRVTDDKNQPMTGVGVIEKGTRNGVETDINGKYSISVNKGSIITFYFIGFLPEERHAAAGQINIRLMPDNLQLEETVVVGYGIQKKSDLTGSISQVKTGDIENRTITSPSQALQGKTAGVEVFSASAKPGSSPTVRIRGISSNGSCSPLYVVDGRLASDISGIDPNDIASMEVLKDGASAAIYGARAGNGVVLITTKKGKGTGKITYDYQYTAQSLNKIPHVMNSEQYIQYYIEDGRFNLEKFYNNWDFKTNTNWADVAFETSVMQHHNITLQAGTDKGSLYISMSYLDNNGMFVGDADTYKRITGMINASWKIKPWMEIVTNNQLEKYKVRSLTDGYDYGSALSSVLQLDPLTRPTYSYDELPQHMLDIINDSSKSPMLQDKNGKYYGISAFNSGENVNPLIVKDRSYSKTTGFNLNGSTSLHFKPIRDITATSRISYLFSNSDTYGYGINYYTNTNAYQNYISLNGSENSTCYYQWENFINYNHTFGKHSISAMVGSSYSENRTFGLSGTYAGSDDDLGVIQNYPSFYYFAYATSTATKTLSGAEPIYTRNLSYFGRINWSYLGKYMLQTSLRADAADSSILPIDQRWGYFPAVSAGWTISEEPFMANIRNWMPYLKLRASWGQNGSTASLGSYLYANVIASDGSYPVDGSNYIVGYSPTSTGNDDLRWETSEQFNVGADARFFKDKLAISADWYVKKTKNLIVTGIKPSTVVGVTASPVNAGDVENKGFEFEVKWQDRARSFNYGVNANIATLKNKVTYLHESLDAIDGTKYRNYGIITRFEKGYPAWYFYGYKYTGTDPATGNATFEDRNESGTITDADKTNLGSGIPDFTYGITLTAGWKGFDAVVFGTGSQGNKIFSCLSVVDYASNRLTAFTKDRWTTSNTKGSMPAANASNWTNFITSSGCVFNGSYFKIKQIQLGYTLPKNLTGKVKIERVRVYGSLDDFFTFTSYPGFDPEVTGVGNSLGVDKGSYPTSKKVVFGVSLTF
ncbi:MAG: TonB-dependent receptor [Bacteroidales bacterium]|jgi:TonB-linked SusC/RagA family outer membrane protein|nr:TonB-dependent receptor [Bacteroidales bacterium]